MGQFFYAVLYVDHDATPRIHSTHSMNHPANAIDERNRKLEELDREYFGASDSMLVTPVRENDSKVWIEKQFYNRGGKIYRTEPTSPEMITEEILEELSRMLIEFVS